MAKKNKIYTDLHKIKFVDKNVISRFSKICDDKAGIINCFMERSELIKYGLYMYQSLSANTAHLFDLSRDVSSGGLGVDFNQQNALLACVGEAVERYCMSYTNPHKIESLRYNELPKAFRLKSFDFYSDEQYEENSSSFVNPKKESIYWTIAQGWNTNSKIYYPASLVYLPFEKQKPVSETSSTGTAAHPDIQEAILSGVLEVIERDAIMINFYKKLPRAELNIKDILKEHTDKKTCAFIEKIMKKFEIKIFKQHSDIRIPIYLAFIWTEDKDGGLHYGIGACASLCSETAILKALKECLFTYFYSKNIMDLKVENKQEIKTLYGHFLYYQKSEKFYDLIQTHKMIPYTPTLNTVKDLRDSLHQNDLSIFYCDLTTQDVAENTTIRVVKVIIPGMIDLSKSYHLLRKDAHRFISVPKKLGFTAIDGLNEEPHPFP